MQWKTFFISSLTLIVLDALFIILNMKTFSNILFKIQKEAMKPKFPSIFLCYILLICGLWFFIIRTKRPIWEAFLLGIFVYGVCETNNYAILNNWQPHIVAIDTLWGGILFASTTYITYTLAK
jgi:uncharacterized membrane protein